MVGPMKQKSPESIRLRGVRQNNLKGIDVEIPVGKLTVVTGLSGAGKSSLVFETLHAEGQRRYVETFSPYTRQFLELLPEADVDAVENVRPSIAIRQGNSVKTSRSTVGTMTELCDRMKIWFAHRAELFDPATGTRLRAWSPTTIRNDALARFAGTTLILAFPVAFPKKIARERILDRYTAAGFTKLLCNGKLFALDTFAGTPDAESSDEIFIVADRIKISDAERDRFLESAASALKFGNGILCIFKPADDTRGNDRFSQCGAYADKLVSPTTRRRFREPSPALFSFNSPVGACPRCRGFGRVIEIDWKKVLPDESKTLAQGVCAAFSGAIYGASQTDLLRAARRKKIPTNVPWSALPADAKNFIINGDDNWDDSDWTRGWYGIRRFFDWLESTSYKMHVRVFLARFRAYTKCPQCNGTRFREESLCWKWRGNTLPQLYSKTADELIALMESIDAGTPGPQQTPEDFAFAETLTRLRYLREVGLGYLTLDRQSRTLSGGETQRVNLTTCLGAALSDTLFILDEPSVGLHARDLGKMVEILRRLVAGGNTVVVVEHDESVMRAADWLIEIGPKPGAAGGKIVYAGVPAGILHCKNSVTGAWLSGTRSRENFSANDSVSENFDFARAPKISLRGVTAHNLKNFAVKIPIHALVGLCGVSGSGKSTLLNNVLAHFATDTAAVPAEDDFELPPFEFKSDIPLNSVVLVDQSPVSKTPRSNPALYTGAWEHVRKLLAGTEEARARGLTASHFSFNSGDGRCPHCNGAGWETVEMQFLSDVHVPCPVCEGKRFAPDVLAFRFNGKNVAEILSMTVSEAKEFFAGTRTIAERLASLENIGLGYLTLGQPLNTLSGGEAQRLKLTKFLSEISIGTARDAAENLILLDEPTTGLHREDVAALIKILRRLVAAGNTLVVIEHQTDVLLACDWLIELGPEAGAAGGKIVAAGTPAQISRGNTATAPFLAEALRNVPAHLKNEYEISSNKQNSGKTLGAGDAMIRLYGVREHNLKNISLALPRRKFTVFTGVSGSGKSSLAFDVIFAEGRRRFMECMSAYARRFVEQLPRPDADAIEALPPTVAIEQRVTRGSAKSTVATVTEVAQFLRLLFAKIGVMHNPATGTALVAGTREQVAERVALALKKSSKSGPLLLAAPLIRNRKGHHQPLANWAIAHGYEKMRIDGKITLLRNFKPLDRYKEHDIELVVAEFSGGNAVKSDAAKVGKSVDDALRLGKGICLLLDARGNAIEWFSRERIDPKTGESFPELEPKNFSWNSPKGWCAACRGHGRIVENWGAEEGALNEDAIADSVTKTICPVCRGERLNAVARAVKIFADARCAAGTAFTLPQLLALPPATVLDVLEHLKLNARERAVAARIVPEVRSRLRFLDGVGLGYLTLERASNTLSGGEAQRIRLAAQLGSNLSGVLYVLDEPSIGLHPRDNVRLIESLKKLRTRGNTVLVVEHDEDTMRAADNLVDLGPGSGTHGGEVLFCGPPKKLRAKNSLTANFLYKGIAHPMRGAWRKIGRGNKFVTLAGARLRNLKNVDVKFAVGRINVVCGVSGAGKSTLVSDLLAPALTFATVKKIDVLSGAAAARVPALFDVECERGALPKPVFKELRGGAQFRKIVVVDQEPIGKTSRSTPATYIGAFDIIRKIFTELPAAKIRGATASFFSFNTKGGRCETCAGAGRIKLEMNFMPDTTVVCEDCAGTRYSPAVADIRLRGKSIADVLEMTFAQAEEFFAFHKKLQEICALMNECGLGYLMLGQSSPTLSGGESQRLKLVSELVSALPSWKERMGKIRAGTSIKNCYILEEPTIGLHRADCEKLLLLLHRLADEGHTIIVVEHHPDVLAEADRIIEIGPEGGNAGGKVLYQGDVPGMLRLPDDASPTAPFLRKIIPSAPPAR